MFGAIAVLFVLPWLDTSRVRSCTFRPIYKWFMFVLVVDVVVLGYLRRQPAGRLSYVPLAQVATLYYFFHFLILLPVLGKIERPLPLPPSIADAVLKKKAVLGPCARPSFPAPSRLPPSAPARSPSPPSPSARPRPSSPPQCTGTSRARSAPTTAPPPSAAIQVYNEVCSACHSLSLLAYRNLMELGLTENQVKGLIKDIPGARHRRRRPADRAAGAPVGPLQEAVPQRAPPRPPPTTARRRPTSASSSRRARAGRTMSMPC